MHLFFFLFAQLSALGMFGCGVPRFPEEEEEQKRLIHDPNFDLKNFEMCRDCGTDVQLSPNGQWLRATKYSMFIPITSISSIRVMRSKRWMGMPVVDQNLVCLHINVVYSERAGTVVVGAPSFDWKEHGNSFDIVSNPMKYADAAKLMSRITGFEISEEIPSQKGPAMP